MRVLPSRVPRTMKIANLFTKDSLLTLIDWFHALQWTHLRKINSLNLATKKSLYQRLLRSVIDDLEAMGEKQSDFCIWATGCKVPISQKITLNKIKIWSRIEEKLNFFQRNLHWRKWIQHAEKEKLWLKNWLNLKLTISLKACAKMVKIASTYTMA